MAKDDEKFNLEKIMRMEEPLTVYLERERGNTQEPIPLPGLHHSGEIDPHATPGTNWTKDSMAKMTAWIRDHWTGAGSYKCQVVDVKGAKQTFTFMFPHSQVPERAAMPFDNMRGIPSPAHVMISEPAPQQQPPPPMPPSMGSPPTVQPPATLGPSNPYGLTFAGHPPGPVQPQPPPQPPPGWASQNGPPWQGAGFGSAPQGFVPPPPVTQTLHQPSRDAMEENRVLREKLAQQEREKLEVTHRSDLERQRLESQRALDELRRNSRGESDEITRAREEREKERAERERLERDYARQLLEAQIKATQDGLKATQEMMAKLAEKFSERQRPEEDDKIRVLMEENRRRDEQHQRDKEKWEQERKEEAARREQEKRDEQIRRAQDEQQRRTEALFAEQNRKHEELVRQLAATANSGPDPMMEFFKETQRQQTEFQRQIQEGHRAALDAQKANAINPIELMRMLKESSSGSDAFMQNMVRSLTGVVDMYKNAATEIVGMSGGGQSSWVPGMIEQGLGTGKEIMERYFAYKAAEAKSTGQARTAEAQAQAITAQSSVASAQTALANMRRGQPPAAAGGLSGAAPADATPTAGVSAPAQANGNGRVIPMRPAKPSDVELFTEQVLPHVENLRASVAEGKLSPLQTIRAIMTGINSVKAANVEVPAFTLYAEKRWADFVDLLLPGTPQDYRDECVSILSKMEAHQHIEEDAEEDAEGEEEDETPAS